LCAHEQQSLRVRGVDRNVFGGGGGGGLLFLYGATADPLSARGR